MNTPHATRQAVGRSAQALRRAELAQIHIAKAQLGLSEDDYRLLLRTVTGKDSARHFVPKHMTVPIKQALAV